VRLGGAAPKLPARLPATPAATPPPVLAGNPAAREAAGRGSDADEDTSCELSESGQTSPDEGMAKQHPGKQRVMAATDEGRRQVQQENVKAGLAPAAAACVAILFACYILFPIFFSSISPSRTDIISCNCTVAHQRKCFENLRQCTVERHDLRKTRDMHDQTSIIAKCRQRVLSLENQDVLLLQAPRYPQHGGWGGNRKQTSSLNAGSSTQTHTPFQALSCSICVSVARGS
jgi:hypothetical protein